MLLVNDSFLFCFRSTGDGQEDYDYVYQENRPSFVMQQSLEDGEYHLSNTDSQRNKNNNDMEVGDFCGPTLTRPGARESIIEYNTNRKEPPPPEVPSRPNKVTKQNTLPPQSNIKASPKCSRKASAPPAVSCRKLPGPPSPPPRTDAARPVKPARPAKPVQTPCVKTNMGELEKVLNATCGRAVVVPKPKKQPRDSHQRYEVGKFLDHWIAFC